MFMPRIGMEVVVDFLEGNPDLPLVVGCVYNGKNPPPLNFPTDASRSTIKTLSSKGGGGFNELRFEDKKDSEEIFVHAQKDLQLRTGNNRTENIGVDCNLTIGKNRIESIGENADLDVGKNQTHSIGLNQAVTVGQEHYLTVGTNHHTDAGMNMALTAGMNVDMNAGVNTAVSAGVNIDVKAGVNLVLEAGAVLSLKAGGSSIMLSAAGVMITGTMVMINSGGSGLSAQKAKKAEKADKPKKAIEAIKNTAGKINDPVQQLQAQGLRNAHREKQPFCAVCEAARHALEALESATESIGYSSPF
jgi:type VI secretion system secreted protein VgrG